MHVLAAFDNLFHDAVYFAFLEFAPRLQKIVEGAPRTILCNDHQLFFHFFFQEREQIRVGERAEDFDFVFDEAFADGLFVESIVDDLDADGFVVGACGFENFCGVAFAYFPLKGVDISIDLDFQHSSL